MDSITPRPHLRPDGIPTRADLRYWTRAESMIADAVNEVETMGASIALTDAVTLLGKARDRVADHVEQYEPPPAPPPSGSGVAMSDEGCVHDTQLFTYCLACRAERAEAALADCRREVDWYGSRAADLARYLSMKPPLIKAVEAVTTELVIDAGKRAAIAKGKPE